MEVCIGIMVGVLVGLFIVANAVYEALIRIAKALESSSRDLRRVADWGGR